MVSTKNLTTIALITALICIVSPFSIPIGPIPVSLSSFIIMLAFAVFKLKKSLIAVCLYILIGAVGVPVFSGFGAGVGKIAGPSGGFILGYILMILAMGLVTFLTKKITGKRYPLLISLIFGTIVLYISGSVWMSITSGLAYKEVLPLAVLPFILPDAAKIAAVYLISPRISKVVR